MLSDTVVPECDGVTEADFRAAMLTGLSRCSRTPAGRKALVSEMDLSSKGLDNVLLKGAMPGAKRLWDATRACPHALADIAKLYGFDMVRRSDHAAAEAAGTVPLAGLLAQVAEAEAPDSDGGAAITHHELLAMEAQIRRVNALTDQWINRITAIRAPRAVGI